MDFQALFIAGCITLVVFLFIEFGITIHNDNKYRKHLVDLISQTSETQSSNSNIRRWSFKSDGNESVMIEITHYTSFIGIDFFYFQLPDETPKFEVSISIDPTSQQITSGYVSKKYYTKLMRPYTELSLEQQSFIKFIFGAVKNHCLSPATE